MCSSDLLTSLIQKMEQVWEALIELANTKDGPGESMMRNMASTIKLLNLQDIQLVHVPIAYIPSTCVPNQISPDFVGKCSAIPVFWE